MNPKPLKKSDIKKEEVWRKKRRTKKIQEQPEYHLIVCEGTKTEPLYFQGLKEEIRKNYSDKIEIEIEPTGKGRFEALKEAQKLVDESINHIGHVWLVYDKDDFPKDEFDNVVFKCNNINKNNEKLDKDILSTDYHVLWSNECIEFWFLLHFIDLKADISRSSYIDKLNEQYKNNGIDESYAKNSKNTYKILRKNLLVAMDRAEKIITENQGVSPSNMKPGTSVYEIFDKLKVYLKIKNKS